MFADTGGIDIDRIVGEQPGWIQAEGRDRMSGTRQCITLNLDRSTAKPMMTDFTIRGLYDAGPALTEPTPNELVRTLGGLADRYDARGLMSGVMLIAKNDQILFEKAYGFASIAHRDPMRTTTRLNLASIGKSLTGVVEPDRRQFAAAFVVGVEAIKSRGKADLGEKTMLDVLIPVSRLLQRLADEGAPLPELCEQLTTEAHRNMLATRDMTATKGRASFLGERALGHIDPGSRTCEVAITAVCETLKETA